MCSFCDIQKDVTLKNKIINRGKMIADDGVEMYIERYWDDDLERHHYLVIEEYESCILNRIVQFCPFCGRDLNKPL